MLEDVLKRQDRRDERQSRSIRFLGYLLLTVLGLGMIGIGAWVFLEPIGWWRVPVVILLLGIALAVVVWLERTKSEKMRDWVTNILFAAVLLSIWGPAIWKRMNLINPVHSLVMAALGLGLWILFWVRLKGWGALNILPFAYAVAVTGYILVGYLSGHMIFAQLMHPAMAGVLFVVTLIVYGVFMYGAWFGKRPATDKIQES